MASTRASETSLVCPYDRRAGRHVGEFAHADEPQPVHRGSSRLLLDGDDPPVGERQRGEVLARLVLHRHHHVLQAGEPVEQPHVLERAHQTLARDLRRVEPDELLAVQLHRAGVGGDGAGEEVEHGRLPGAVRPDEGGDRAPPELDVQVVGGDDAAEALADTAGLEHDRRVEPLLVAIDLVRDILPAFGAVSSLHVFGVLPRMHTLARARSCMPMLLGTQPSTISTRWRRARSPRNQRHSEKPSGSAPCGRTRISTAKASP